MTETTSDHLPTDNLKAIILMVVCMMCFAIDDAAIKAAGTFDDGFATPGEIVLIKGVLGGLLYGALLRSEGKHLTFDLVRSLFSDRLLNVRTFGDLLSAMAIITALSLMPLSEFSAIMQVQPLVVTLGAALILKETVGWRRWSAICVGFVGVLIIIQPTGEGYDASTLWAVLAVVGLAIRDLATRRIKVRFSTFSIVTVVAWLLVPMGIVMHFIMTPGPMLNDISWQAWALIIGGGLFGMVGYYAITVSMRIGELSAIAPYRYTRLVAHLTLAYIFFAEVPTPAMMIGAALVIGAGLFTLYRERKLSRRPA